MALIFGVLLFVLVFLVGVLVIACALSVRYGDPSASYKLYAVRDRIIDAVVFRGVPRDNPWLDAIYENVNSILVHSKLLCGPERWGLAIAVGEYQAKNPHVGKQLRPLPSEPECPKELVEIESDLRDALGHLVKNHTGMLLHRSAHKREERRIQKEKAEKLLKMIGPRNGKHALA